MGKETIENFSVETITGIKVLKPGDHWWTVTYGMSGWFAVEMWINPGEKGMLPPHANTGPFPEPWTTGFGRYRLKSQAYAEAKMGAATEGLPLELVRIDDDTAN